MTSEQLAGKGPALQHGGMNIWLLVLLVFVTAVVVSAVVAFVLFSRLDARLLLIDTPATITLLDKLDVSAEVKNDLSISIDEVIDTEVPIDQTISVPIRQSLTVMTDFDGIVPVRMDVPIKHVIFLDQVVEIDAVVDVEMLGDTHQIPVRGSIPVKGEVPLDIVVPIDQQLPLKFRSPVQASFSDALQIPLKTTINASIPIQSDMTVPVHNALEAIVDTREQPLDIVINYSDLRLPLRALEWETVDPDEPLPKRRNSETGDE